MRSPRFYLALALVLVVVAEPCGASAMAPSDQTPAEIVSRAIASCDVALEGTVYRVDNYIHGETPVFDAIPRRSCAVLHVLVNEYLYGSGPDTVRLVYDVPERPDGKIAFSCPWGTMHPVRRGERAIFRVGWWDQLTAEVSYGAVWSIEDGVVQIPLPGAPWLKLDYGWVLGVIREEAKRLREEKWWGARYRMVRGPFAERLEAVSP